MKDRLWQLTLGTAFAGALGILSFPVSAGPYRAFFDPDNFDGYADFAIANEQACLVDMGAGSRSSTGVCATTVLGAHVNMQQGSASVSFDINPANPSGLVNEFLVDSFGNIIGWDTDVIGYTTLSGQSEPSFNGTWGIRYVLPDIGFGPADVIPPAVTGEVELWQCTELQGCGPTGVTALVTEIVDLKAPEPGTLALMFGALGVGWLTRRRLAAA